MAVPFLFVQLHLTQIYPHLYPITHTLCVNPGVSCLLAFNHDIHRSEMHLHFSVFLYQSSSFLLKFGQILSLLGCIP